jgi:transcriptional regulator with XRE-family HTH domain
MIRKLHKLTGQRSVKATDIQLGVKIRARRLEAGLSQQELGEALGVSFQQVQKYEKGVNRVSAGRLGEIAKTLGESMAYFTGTETAVTTKFTKLLTDAPSQRLLTAFATIADQATRYKIVGLVESMAHMKKKAA